MLIINKVGALLQFYILFFVKNRVVISVFCINIEKGCKMQSLLKP